MWQWCVCARAIGLLYIHVPHVAYKPNCKVIHFLKWTAIAIASIDHYCSYLHGNISYINIIYYGIIFLQLVSGFTVYNYHHVWDHLPDSYVQCNKTYCHSGIVFSLRSRCWFFSYLSCCWSICNMLQVCTSCTTWLATQLGTSCIWWFNVMHCAHHVKCRWQLLNVHIR